MSEMLKWRLTDISRVFEVDGNLVIGGTEKHRGMVGVTIAADQVGWLLACLHDLERDGAFSAGTS